MSSFIDPASFIDKSIFDLIGLENIPADQKERIESSMLKTIQNRILARILDSLTDEEIKEFDELAIAKDDEATRAFFTKHDINLTKISAEEALNYKVEMVNILRGD